MSRAEVRRLVRFCGVGAMNTAVTLAVFAMLVYAGCPGWLASALAFAAGAANGYYWNARWTFADRQQPWRRGRVRLRYAAVQGTGSAASAIGVLAVHDLLGLSHLAAEGITLPGVIVLTYVLIRRFVFPAVTAPPATATAEAATSTA
jgi:putative flippase GtrA